ncbi:MAG: PD40 domain-containing protein, partial [Acidobacteriia bacterium]|nr:PD40 domain-containing protein [Terriglobia bacterium]
QYLAMASTDGGNSDIWVHSLKKNTTTRLTFSPEDEVMPVWTRDGRHIFFGSTGGISWIPADGSGSAQRLLEFKNSFSSISLSPDGKRLAYSHVAPQTNYDIWTVPIHWNPAGIPQAGKPEPFHATAFAEFHPAFSPEGRWLAYVSAEFGAAEVFVRPAPGSASKASGGKWQISKGGARMPRWSPNRRELFYRTEDFQLMVVDYEVKGDSFIPGTPRAWSTQRIPAVGAAYNFDITPDGKRFAVVVPPDAPDAGNQQSHVTYLQNFFDDVRRKIKQSGSQ